MTSTGNDSLNTRTTLKVGDRTYAYYSLAKAGAALGDISRLPFAMKVLLENLLRLEWSPYRPPARIARSVSTSSRCRSSSSMSPTAASDGGAAPISCF